MMKDKMLVVGLGEVGTAMFLGERKWEVQNLWL